MLFSNRVMYCIVLTPAATPHPHGKITISSACDVGEALRPSAGDRVGSLEVHPPLTHGFYAAIAIAMALGLDLDYAGLNAVKMLFWSAVLNGALAPPLLILVISHRRTGVRGEHKNELLLRWLGWTCTAVTPVTTFAA